MKLNFLIVLIIGALLGVTMAAAGQNGQGGPPSGPPPSGKPPNGPPPSGRPPNGGGRGPPPSSNNATSSG